MPGWLAQDEYEKLTAVGFGLERLTKTVDRLVTTTSGLLYSYASAQRANVPGGEIIKKQTNSSRRAWIRTAAPK